MPLAVLLDSISIMKTSQEILILGLGGVGRYLARQLTEAGHAITVIESDPDAIRRAEGSSTPG